MAVKDRIFNLFSSLRHRNFRVYLVGQSISLIGTSIQNTAVGWLLWRLTQSTSSLGWLVFCSQIPFAVLVTGAGVLADHFDRRRLLLFMQFLGLAQAAVLTLLAWFNVITPRDILILSVFSGIISAIGLPARQTLIPALLDGNDNLGNAIGLDSNVINLTRLLGPIFAGWLVARSGEGYCFLINSVSFLAPIVALMRIRLPPRSEHCVRVDFWSHWKEGFSYAYGHHAIREMFEMLIIAIMVNSPGITLMPAVVQALHGGPALLGTLMAAASFGSIIGGFAMGSTRIKGAEEIHRLVFWIAATVPILTILFSLTRSIPVVMCLAVIIGFSFTLLAVASNTYIQLMVPDVKRGRVMSLLTWSLLGLPPVGCLLAGYIAERIGVFPTIRLAGCLGVAAVLLVGLGSRRVALRTKMDSLANPHA